MVSFAYEIVDTRTSTYSHTPESRPLTVFDHPFAKNRTMKWILQTTMSQTESNWMVNSNRCTTHMDLLQCCKSALKYKLTKSAHNDGDGVKEWRVINAVQWIDVMFHFHICPAFPFEMYQIKWICMVCLMCICVGNNVCLDKIYIVITENRRQQR